MGGKVVHSLLQLLERWSCRQVDFCKFGQGWCLLVYPIFVFSLPLLDVS